MKRKILILAAVMTMFFAFGAINVNAASSGTCGDNLIWVLDDEGTLTISGTGDMWDYGEYLFPWSHNIKRVVIDDGVTSIGNSVFFERSSLTEIEIPDSVTSIGSCAFYYCVGLVKIEIPDSVTTIGDSAFNRCFSLKNIEIPDSVTSIGDYAFDYCSRLTEITVDENNPNYSSKDGILFNKDKTELIQYPSAKMDSKYIIPSSVTRIGDNAFMECIRLTEIELPDRVTSIEDGAFSSCSDLTSIKLPDGVTSIGDSVFNSCRDLTSIELPDRVTSIGDMAFYGCGSLTNIEIPDSVTSIGNMAFHGCSSLTSIEIPDRVTSIGKNTFSQCSSLTSIEIPNRVTSIGNMAFFVCNNLKTVYYTGTEAEWNAISVGSGNDDLTNAKIVFNCNDRELPDVATEEFETEVDGEDVPAKGYKAEFLLNESFLSPTKIVWKIMSSLGETKMNPEMEIKTTISGESVIRFGLIVTGLAEQLDSLSVEAVLE